VVQNAKGFGLPKETRYIPKYIRVVQNTKGFGLPKETSYIPKYIRVVQNTKGYIPSYIPKQFTFAKGKCT